MDEARMVEAQAELDGFQKAYKTAADAWVTAIREEEALASVPHSIAEIDRWEAAHFREEDLRGAALEAKSRYEDALRKAFFDF